MNLAPMIQAAAARGAVACDSCDAEYRVQRMPGAEHVTLLKILHDDDCPALLARTTNRAQRRAARRKETR